MFGTGIIRGLGITLRRTVDTFVDDFKKTPSRYTNAIETPQGKILQEPTDVHGLFTIQYPDGGNTQIGQPAVHFYPFVFLAGPFHYGKMGPHLL